MNQLPKGVMLFHSPLSNNNVKHGYLLTMNANAYRIWIYRGVGIVTLLISLSVFGLKVTQRSAHSTNPSGAVNHDGGSNLLRHREMDVDVYQIPENLSRFRDACVSGNASVDELHQLLNSDRITYRQANSLISAIGVDAISNFLSKYGNVPYGEDNLNLLYYAVFDRLVETNVEKCIENAKMLNPNRLTTAQFSKLLAVAFNDSSGNIRTSISRELFPDSVWSTRSDGSLMGLLLDSGHNVQSAIKSLESVSDDGILAAEVVNCYYSLEDRRMDLDSEDGISLLAYIEKSSKMGLYRDHLVEKLRSENEKIHIVREKQGANIPQ